jgi:uncharacterized protein
VRVLDIAEERAKEIELMFNKVVEEINQHNTPIIYIQVSENHFLYYWAIKNSGS